MDTPIQVAEQVLKHDPYQVNQLAAKRYQYLIKIKGIVDEWQKNQLDPNRMTDMHRSFDNDQTRIQLRYAIQQPDGLIIYEPTIDDSENPGKPLHLTGGDSEERRSFFADQYDKLHHVVTRTTLTVEQAQVMACQTLGNDVQERLPDMIEEAGTKHHLTPPDPKPTTTVWLGATDERHLAMGVATTLQLWETISLGPDKEDLVPKTEIATVLSADFGTGDGYLALFSDEPLPLRAEVAANLVSHIELTPTLTSLPKAAPKNWWGRLTQMVTCV